MWLIPTADNLHHVSVIGCPRTAIVVQTMLQTPEGRDVHLPEPVELVHRTVWRGGHEYEDIAAGLR